VTTASGTLRGASGRPMATLDARGVRSRRRRIAGLVVVLVGLAILWEGAKWLGGDPWRIHATIAGIQIDL